jgi:hypothetical protein
MAAAYFLRLEGPGRVLEEQLAVALDAQALAGISLKETN